MCDTSLLSTPTSKTHSSNSAAIVSLAVKAWPTKYCGLGTVALPLFSLIY